MLAIGFPLGLQGILFPIANSIIHAQINKMGTEVIAAWAVCGKLDLLIWLVADACSCSRDPSEDCSLRRKTTRSSRR